MRQIARIARWARRLGALSGTLAVASLVAVAGCSSSGSSSASSSSTAGGSSTNSSTEGSLTEVKVAVSIATLSNAGLYVAMANGYFTKEGLKIIPVQTSSDTVSAQSVESSSVDYASAGAADIPAAAAQGISFEAIANMTGPTLELCAAPKVADSKKLTVSSSPKQIFTALAGTPIGVTGLATGPAETLKYLFHVYAGVAPDLVSLSSTAGVLTALSRGEISAFLQSPPNCESAQADGSGVHLLNTASLPAISQVPQNVLYGQATFIKANPSLTRKFATAIGEGDNFARTNTAGTLKILAPYFPNVSAATLRTAFTEIVQPTIPANGQMTTKGWQELINELTFSGTVPSSVGQKVGEMWTNDYL